MRLRRVLPYAAALTLGCQAVDHVLEGPMPTDARISVVVQGAGTVTVPTASDQVLTATITRTGDYSGDVALSVEGMPAGVTAVVSGTSTVGKVTTSTLTIHVAADATIATYVLTVRGHADPRIPDGVTNLTLVIVDPTRFTLALGAPSVTIARGGIADAIVNLGRTNLAAPIALSLDGVPGVTATFGTNPVTSSSTVATLSVDGSVSAGTYTATLHGTASGAPDRSVPVAITVTSDAIQLIAPVSANVSQAASISAEFIVNHTGTGAVALSVDNLPTGVTATFQPASVAGNRATFTLVAGSAAMPATYPLTLRGKVAGAADGTTVVPLTVTPASIAIAFANPTITVLPGTNASATLTITRTQYTGDVGISVASAPAGFAVTATPATVTGTTTSIVVTAASTVVPGAYSIVLKASPTGLAASASQTATLGVIVNAAQVGLQNVTLDWSGCVTPDWVASQDGSGAWAQVIPAAGIARFTVNSPRGAFAYADNAGTTAVRYMTQAELTAGTIDLCGTPAGAKTVVGTVRTTLSGTSSYVSLGGGSAVVSSSATALVIPGVRDGAQDLVAWGGGRGLIRRDLDLPDGGSLGLVDLLGSESFLPSTVNVTVNGPIGAGEQMLSSMNFLTTAACTANMLASSSFGTATVAFNAAFGSQQPGVPSTLQRVTDFQLFTMFANGGNSSRSASIAFNGSTAQVALPPALPTPAVTSLPGSGTRLQLSLASIPAAYNGALALQFGSGARTVTVSASTASAGSGPVTLAAPDLSGVSGWKPAFGVTSGASGTWKFAADGANAAGSQCTNNRSSVLATLTGSF